MYKVQIENNNNLREIKLINIISGEHCVIVPDIGANVSNLVLGNQNNLLIILDGNEKSEDFAGNQLFKGAKLYPFPNRLKDGEYKFNNSIFQLALNYPEENNACHGFIFDKEFSIIESAENSDKASVTLTYKYDGEIKGYPFPFNLNITYSLSIDGFTCTTNIENKSSKPMPMGDGWHPFFTFGKKIDDLHIQFPSSYLFEVDDRLIPTGRKETYKIFNKFQRIGSTEFDSCFEFQSLKKGIQMTEIFDPEQNSTIQLWQETGVNKYNYLQIYTPPHRNSIAIEPMTCIANSFNNNIGLIELPKGGTFEARYGVRLKIGKND